MQCVNAFKILALWQLYYWVNAAVIYLLSLAGEFNTEGLKNNNNNNNINYLYWN